MPRILPLSVKPNVTLKSLKTLKQNTNNIHRSPKIDLNYEDLGYYRVGNSIIKQIFPR